MQVSVIAFDFRNILLQHVGMHGNRSRVFYGKDKFAA